MQSLYSEKYNIELYNIPKNGMTTLIYHLELDYVLTSTIKTNPTIFCVLRNPSDRLISSYIFLRWYYSKILKARNLFETPKASLYNFPTMFRQLDHSLFLQIFVDDDIDNGFILYIDELYSNGAFDDHNKSQYKYITSHDKIAIFPLHKMNRSISSINKFIDFDHLEQNVQKLIKKPDFKLMKPFYVSSKTMFANLKVIAMKYKTKIQCIYAKDYMLYNKHIIK